MFDLSFFDVGIQAARARVIKEVGEELDQEWPGFCRKIAGIILTAERGWKERQDPAFAHGYLRLDYLQDELRKLIGTDAMRAGLFDAFFAIVQVRLARIVDKVNATIGNDWVGRWEEVEEIITNEMERYFKLDLDNDGDIGLPGAPALVLLLALSFGLL